MVEKNKPIGSLSPASDAEAHGLEGVLRKWLDPAKGFVFVVPGKGPHVAFAIEQAALPALSQIIDELKKREPVVVTYSTDHDRVTVRLNEKSKQLFEEKLNKINYNRTILEKTSVIPPFLTGFGRRTHAAIFSFWAGVIPPSAMLGRSLL